MAVQLGPHLLTRVKAQFVAVHTPKNSHFGAQSWCPSSGSGALGKIFITQLEGQESAPVFLSVGEKKIPTGPKGKMVTSVSLGCGWKRLGSCCAVAVHPCQYSCLSITACFQLGLGWGVCHVNHLLIPF